MDTHFVVKKVPTDWYCHNLCNFKENQWNQDIFSRNFPEMKQYLPVDPRPDIQYCGKIVHGDQNVVKQPNLYRNLNPNRSDKDCYFCQLLINFSPNRGDALNYLRKMDVDSYLRGITDKYGKYPGAKANAHCIIKNACRTCKYEGIHEEPKVVEILFGQQQKYYNGCDNVKPQERMINNRTKATAIRQPKYNYGKGCGC